MANPTFVNGFGGSWVVGSYTAVVGNWSSDISTDLIPTTNTGDNGWKSHIPGALGGSFSMETWIDVANDNLSVFYPQPNTQPTFSLLIANSGRNLSFKGTIKNCKIKNVAGGEVTLSVDVEATGQVTLA